MTTYISLATALQMISNAYLFSSVLLIAVSYIGWAAIEQIEKISDY